jgi:hypothetical protein
MLGFDVREIRKDDGVGVLRTTLRLQDGKPTQSPREHVGQTGKVVCLSANPFTLSAERKK